MIRVKLTTPSPIIPLVRQTPGGFGVWEDCQFFVNDDSREFDWWFVAHNPYRKETAKGTGEQTVLITAEAAEMKHYRKDFTDQFHYVITCQRNIVHPRKIYRQQGLPWMIGHMGGPSGIDPKDFKKYFTPYDTLKTMARPDKTKKISVITSYKSRTAGQEKRHALIAALKNHFGDALDVYGTGVRYIRDKWDGIAPYQYHLAIENSAVDDYWTEKLSDAYLGFAFPFYFGCPNLARYFKEQAFIRIDVNDPAFSIAAIERALAEKIYEKRLAAVQEARALVLDRYNIFAMITEFIHSHQAAAAQSAAVSVTVSPEREQWIKKRLVRVINRIPVVREVAKRGYRAYRGLKNNNK